MYDPSRRQESQARARAQAQADSDSEESDSTRIQRRVNLECCGKDTLQERTRR